MSLTIEKSTKKGSRRLFETLIEAAIQVRQRAYAPYSRFMVGAAILGKDSCIYKGCNVENASFGLTICAERNAVASMIASGCREILSIAVALEGKGTPCGACRQVLAEFGENFPVLIIDVNEESVIQRTTIDELLPKAFRLTKS